MRLGGDCPALGGNSAPIAAGLGEAGPTFAKASAGRPGVRPFDKPLDMLGALSLSKRLRVGDPGYKFYLIAEKTLLRVWAFEGERLRQQPTPGPPIAPCLASRARGQRLIRQSWAEEWRVPLRGGDCV